MNGKMTLLAIGIVLVFFLFLTNAGVFFVKQFSMLHTCPLMGPPCDSRISSSVATPSGTFLFRLSVNFCNSHGCLHNMDHNEIPVSFLSSRKCFENKRRKIAPSKIDEAYYRGC